MSKAPANSNRTDAGLAEVYAAYAKRVRDGDLPPRKEHDELERRQQSFSRNTMNFAASLPA